MTHNRWLSAALFGSLAFNPVLWSAQLTRVIREAEYIGISLAVIALAALLLLIPQRGRSSVSQFALGAGLGLVGGLYWLTREDGIWLTPALALLVLTAAFDLWRNERSLICGTSRHAAAFAGATLLPVLTFVILLSSIATINYIKYRAFIINELKSTPFLSAYGALTRIRHDHWQRYIVFPADAREKAYSVSEAARQLRPSLDGTLGDAWSKGACEQLKIERCDGVPGGWFIWAFRDLVASTGNYSSAAKALVFYTRLAAEINDACDTGRIDCFPARATLAPPFRWHYITDAIGEIPALVQLLLGFGFNEIGAPPSEGPQFWLHQFEVLVGRLSRETKPFAFIAGTVSSPTGTIELAIRDRYGEFYRSDLMMYPRAPQQDIGGRHDAFELVTDCLRPGCHLVVSWGAKQREVPVHNIAHETIVNDGDMELRVGMVSAGRVSERKENMQLRVMRMIGSAYAAIAPGLAAVAVAGVLVAIALRSVISIPRGIIGFALACFAAVFTRLCIAGLHPRDIVSHH